MKKTIQIFIVIILFSSSLWSASIKGFIRDNKSKKPIIGCFIFEQDELFGTSTDGSGEYVIKDLAVGKYVIFIANNLYYSIIDTIHIENKNQVLVKDYYLTSKYVEFQMPIKDDIEIYHRQLSELRQDESIIEITLDRIEYQSGYVYFYATFRNNTDLPIYILRTSNCFHPINSIITNSKGDTMKMNCINLGCDVGSPKFHPPSSELIIIEPNSIYKYPRTNCHLYYLGNLQRDVYRLSIEYDYKFPEYFRGWKTKKDIPPEIFFSDEIRASQLLIRGSYKSKNSLIFKNK
jgi:hypothetical protein